MEQTFWWAHAKLGPMPEKASHDRKATVCNNTRKTARRRQSDAHTQVLTIEKKVTVRAKTRCAHKEWAGDAPRSIPLY